MLPFLDGKIIGVASVLLTSTRALGSESVSGDCPANRPNKSPDCGVEVVGQGEGNNGEDEFGMLCKGDVSGGSINVRNMACVRDDESLRENAYKEHCNVSCKKLNNLSRTNEKKLRV